MCVCAYVRWGLEVIRRDKNRFGLSQKNTHTSHFDNSVLNSFIYPNPGRRRIPSEMMRALPHYHVPIHHNQSHPNSTLFSSQSIHIPNHNVIILSYHILSYNILILRGRKIPSKHKSNYKKNGQISSPYPFIRSWIRYTLS